MSYFLRQNNLFEMIMESTPKAFLEFEINKGLTLRTFLGPAGFKQLVECCVRMIGDSDPKLTICLLDKVGEEREVLKEMAKMQANLLQRQKPTNFCSMQIEVTPQSSSQVNTQPRVFVQFKDLLATYKKSGCEGKHKDLYYSLVQGDLVSQSFDILCKESELSVDEAKKAYTLLNSLVFVPSYKSRMAPEKMMQDVQKAANHFPQLSADLQTISLDVVVCISKLAFYLSQIRKSDTKLMHEQTKAGNDCREEVKRLQEH